MSLFINQNAGQIEAPYGTWLYFMTTSIPQAAMDARMSNREGKCLPPPIDQMSEDLAKHQPFTCRWSPCIVRMDHDLSRHSQSSHRIPITIQSRDLRTTYHLNTCLSCAKATPISIPHSFDTRIPGPRLPLDFLHRVSARCR